MFEIQPQLFRQVLFERGCDGKEFGRAAGVGNETIRRLTNGARDGAPARFSNRTGKKVAAALGLTPVELLHKVGGRVL